MQTARNGKIELAYELFGPAHGEPILLINGAAGQMIHWPDELITGLIERGFQVVRYDHRDTGRSTRCADGEYTADDIIADAIALLDHLGWESAHLFGVSMGGIVGQMLAARHPARVRSLTSISAPPASQLRIAGMRPSLFWKVPMAMRAARKLHGEDKRAVAIETNLRIGELVSTPRYPVDEQWARDIAGRAYDIDNDDGAFSRQAKAMRTSGDRRAELRTVSAPTLVVHGEQDPMVSPKAGAMVAEAVPGARLLTLPDVGHGLPTQLVPTVLDALCELIGKPTEGLPSALP